MRVLADRGGPWQRAELPHLATALYLLIFGYFASAALFEAVTQEDPRSPAAVAAPAALSAYGARTSADHRGGRRSTAPAPAHALLPEAAERVDVEELV